MKKLTEIVQNGLKHGFFECTVSGEITSGKKRRLMIKAGNSYQYVISPEDIGDG